MADAVRPRLACGDRRRRARAGKTETLLGRLATRCAGREGLEVSSCSRACGPRRSRSGSEGATAPAAALNFAASADAQGQAVERALDAAKRVAARGGDALVLIDTLDGLHPHAARKALAAARNLRDGGSLTVIATATPPLGGRDHRDRARRQLSRPAAGRPILDLAGQRHAAPRAARRRGRRARRSRKAQRAERP